MRDLTHNHANKIFPVNPSIALTINVRTRHNKDDQLKLVKTRNHQSQYLLSATVDLAGNRSVKNGK